MVGPESRGPVNRAPKAADREVQMSEVAGGILPEIDRIVRELIAPTAVTIDREAAFPEDAVRALGEAGVLGLLSAPEVGGLGGGPADAVAVIERLARECGSTAMVVCMHYAGTLVVEKHGADEARRALASGERLTTLAFSEQGSRSHFWAPVSSATPVDGGVRLDAQKSWITSARRATDYVWSSKPAAAEGASTVWLVPSSAEGLSVTAPFDGLGLRGNDSSPVSAVGVEVPLSARLGEDGAGMGIMMEVVLPFFSIMNAACSLGLMEGALARAIAHVSGTRHVHLDQALCQLPTIRAAVARARIRADMTRHLLLDTCAAMSAGREDAPLRVLEAKAAAGDAALEVTDVAMRVCGGAAFRKDLGIERLFRDARAAHVMAPTTDHLYDFIGRALCGLPLF